MLLPNANFERENPDISLTNLGIKVPTFCCIPIPGTSGTDCHFQVPTQCIDWPSSGVKRVSINNFGFGGANAHLILEEAPKIDLDISSLKLDADAQQLSPRLYVFSAKDKDCLLQYITSVRDYLSTDGHDEPNFMADLSNTTCCRRSIFGYRVSASASTKGELVEKLHHLPSIGRLSTGPKLEFVFSGQGAQWPQMGLSLLKYPRFAQAMSDAQACLTKFGAEWSLIGNLWPVCNGEMDSYPTDSILQMRSRNNQWGPRLEKPISVNQQRLHYNWPWYRSLTVGVFDHRRFAGIPVVRSQPPTPLGSLIFLPAWQ